MVEVEHPHWRCPGYGIVIHWAGANSDKNRCTVGHEPWGRELLDTVNNKLIFGGEGTQTSCENR
jgi:hypothetical protein